jgi:protein-tyrosine phosphatase
MSSVRDKLTHILGHKGFDYDQIDENVFLGTNMCCQLGFDKELLTKNVRADISLESDRVDAPNGVDYFLWLPTIDHESPSLDKLILGVETLDFLIKRNIKVYIHCRNGHGRAPTLFAAYLIKNGMKVLDAINYLKSKRPTIHLTKNQISGLKSYQKSLK